MEGFIGSMDCGMTSLKRDKNVSKSDDRIQAIGELEELIAQLGMIKLHAQEPSLKEDLERIQKNLLVCIEGISDPYAQEYRIREDALQFLQERIKSLTDACPVTDRRQLPGECEASLRIDLARSAARRAERWLTSSDKKYGGQPLRKQYLNLLGDYLYALAGYTEHVHCEKQDQKDAEASKVQLTQEMVVQEVLKRIQTMDRVTLEIAKKLIEEVERRAESAGKKAVIAVCGPDGNPVAVHVMDGAFLVSFDVAVKKAYTAVSVKMSTMELGKLVQPGQTFAGLETIEKDRLVFFGGGVPLFVGDRLVGGIGISGGTGEEDDELARYAINVFEGLCK